MKKLGWLVVVGAVAFACGEAGQSMTGGAGAMDGGGGTTNGTGATDGGGATGGTPEQNVREVECKEGSDGSFPIENPGDAYAIVCRRANEQAGLDAYCYRSAVFWFQGTKNGFIPTCIDVTSVTVYD